MIHHRTSAFFIVAIIIVSIFCVPTVSAANAEVSQNHHIYRILGLINEERSAIGLHPLRMNENQSDIAALRLNDMVTKVYFGHDFENLGSVIEFAEKMHFPYSYIGENLALGYSEPISLVSAWMDSPEHRNNLLNPRYYSFGMDATETTDGLLIVAVFSDVIPVYTTPTHDIQPASIIRAQQLMNWDDLPLQISQFLQLQIKHFPIAK